MVNDSLFITKIFLENWAQFEQLELDFPLETDIETESIPIYFFIGRNGAGKTRLFQAIRVILFGKSDSSIESSNIFTFFPSLKQEDILRKLKSGEKIPPQSINLSLTLLEQKVSKLKLYHQITRSFNFSDFSLNKDNSIISKITENLTYNLKSRFNWEPKTEKEIINKIEDWFPPEVREFYFFDGEKLNELMVKNQERKDTLIKEKIMRKSDCYKVDKILEFVKKQSKRFEESAQKKERKSELVEEAEEGLKAYEELLNKKEKEKTQLEEEISTLNTQISQIESELENLNITQARHDKINLEKSKLKKFQMLDTKFEKKYNELSLFLGNLNEKTYNFQLILINDILKEVYDDLLDKMEKGIIPTKLDKGIYDLILKRGRCLCKKNIDVAMKKIIEEERDQVIDEALNDEARRFLNFLKTTLNQHEEKKQKIITTRDECIKINSDIILEGDRPGDTKDEEALFQTYIKLRDEKDKKKKIRNKKRSQYEDLKKEIQEFTDNKYSCQDLLNKRRIAEGKISKDDMFSYTASRIERLLLKINQQLNHYIIEYIKTQTNDTFLKLIEPKDMYAGVYIGDDWQFGYYMKNAPNTKIVGGTGPSKGQFHILGISFLHSLSGTTFFRLPILFDTPLGRIDEIHKQNIGINLPILFKGTQIILFLTAVEAQNMIKYISGKKGWYIINNNNIQAICEEIAADEESLLKTIHDIKIQDELNAKLKAANN